MFLSAELAENVMAGWRQNEPEDPRTKPEDLIGDKEYGVRLYTLELISNC